MKQALPLLPAALFWLLPGCERPRPTPIEDAKLGIRIVFPGEPRKTRYSEPTPFSPVEPIEWYGYRYSPQARMDEDFHLDVGNLPSGGRPGDSILPRNAQGASVPIGTVSVRSVLDVFRSFLEQRVGTIQQQELSPERGPGFFYRGRGNSGYTIEGVVILRGWRLHHAQATVKRNDDPRLRAFLDSLEVLPG